MLDFLTTGTGAINEVRRALVWYLKRKKVILKLKVFWFFLVFLAEGF